MVRVTGPSGNMNSMKLKYPKFLETLARIQNEENKSNLYEFMQVVSSFGLVVRVDATSDPRQALTCEYGTGVFFCPAINSDAEIDEDFDDEEEFNYGESTERIPFSRLAIHD